MSEISQSGQLRQIPIVCPGHSRPLAEVHYSPITSDGFFLVSACHDKLPMLRRGDSGDWIGTFEGHKGAVWSAKLDSYGKKAATGSADFSAKVWNAITGDEIHNFNHKHIVKSVEFLDDGSSLMTGGHDKIVRVFDLNKPEVEATTFTCNDAIRKVVRINDNLVVSGDIAGNMKIWDRRSRECTNDINVGDGIMDIESSRSGSILTVAAGKKVVFLDSSNSFKTLSSYDMPISFSEEGGASLHPSMNRFIAGGSDTWVRVFDYSNGEMLECHKGHHGPVRCLRYAPGGGSFATGSEDGTIRIWQTDLKSSAAKTVSEINQE